MEELPYEVQIKKYSRDELLSVANDMNRQQYPERYKLILDELARRPPPAPDPLPRNMKYCLSSRSFGAKAAWLLSWVFSTLGLKLLLSTPEVLFLWVFSAFFVFATAMCTYSLWKNFTWSFETSETRVAFVSPWNPKVEGCIDIKDIVAVTIWDGDTTSGAIVTTTGEKIGIPGQCLSQPRAIAHDLRQIGVTVTFNGKKL